MQAEKKGGKTCKREGKRAGMKRSEGNNANGRANM